MAEERVNFRCPHCRREYSMLLDADRLARLDRIAVCGRCRKRFSLARRVREANSDPPPDEPPVSQRDLRAAIIAKREREKEKREEAMRERARRLDVQRQLERQDRERRERSRAKREEPPSSERKRSLPPPKSKPAAKPAPKPKPKSKPKPELQPPVLESLIEAVEEKPPSSKGGVSMPRRSSKPPTTPVPPPPSSEPSQPGRRQRHTPSIPGMEAERKSEPDAGKRRWRDSVPKMVAVEPPPELSVRESEPGGPPKHKTPPLPLKGAKSATEDGPKRRNTAPGIGGIAPSRPAPESVPPPPSEPPPAEEERKPLYSQPPEIDEDLFDEDAGDRPTLLLPDEAMMAEMALAAGEEAAPRADTARNVSPRNVSARIVMSRTDWIKLADPGLPSLHRDEGEDVKALVALLELNP